MANPFLILGKGRETKSIPKEENDEKERITNIVR